MGAHSVHRGCVIFASRTDDDRTAVERGSRELATAATAATIAALDDATPTEWLDAREHKLGAHGRAVPTMRPKCAPLHRLGRRALGKPWSAPARPYTTREEHCSPYTLRQRLIFSLIGFDPSGARYPPCAQNAPRAVTQTWQARPRNCLLYTSPSPRDATLSRMPSSA